MTLVLFRHAQKGLVPFEDPELSPQGFRQAQALQNLIATKVLPTPTKLWASKKIRTAQTLGFTADTLSLHIEAKTDFNIREDHENLHQFRDRISQALNTIIKELQQTDTVLFVCTHYDWIEESMSLIPCDKNLLSHEFSHWAPAQYLMLQYNPDQKMWLFQKSGTAKSL